MESCVRVDVVIFHRRQIFSSKGGKTADMAELQITEYMGERYTGKFPSDRLQAQMVESEGWRKRY